MKPTPKTLQVFLPEGTPNGIQIAELTTRIVLAISVPRTHLKAFFERPESNYVGTYFLFGNEDDSSKPLAYIGQTEDLKQRLRKHDSNKEFWNRAVILVSRTHSFTQAHIKWLEWHSIAVATDTKRYKLENGNKGSEPHITEAIHADLLEVFETGSLLIQSLGYPIFDSLIPKTAATSTESEVWHLKGPDTQATGTFSSSGFVIHQGSLCRKDLTKSAKDSFVSKKRAILLKDEILTKTETHYVFAEDYEFNSPSGAAVVALGRHANGWKEWKNLQGHSLDQVKRKNL